MNANYAHFPNALNTAYRMERTSFKPLTCLPKPALTGVTINRQAAHDELVEVRGYTAEQVLAFAQRESEARVQAALSSAKTRCALTPADEGKFFAWDLWVLRNGDDSVVNLAASEYTKLREAAAVGVEAQEKADLFDWLVSNSSIGWTLDQRAGSLGV